jgi:hypothetical protein
MSFKQHDKRGVIGGKVNGFTLARAHTVHNRVVADAVQKFLARPVTCLAGCAAPALCHKADWRLRWLRLA